MTIAAVLASTACDLVVRGGAAGDGGGGSGGGGGSADGGGGSGGEGGSGGGSGDTSGSGGSMPGLCVPGSVITCYTGPAGTAHIGPCATGTQTCRSDGLGYGPCTGDVAPAAEICVTPVDESCDGEPHCPRVPPWARGYGGPGQDNGLSIVIDASGNTYVSGDFEGTVDFGAGPLTSAGGSDIFLLKLDPSGTVIWSRRFGTEHDESATMTVDGSGNIFLAGLYGDPASPWAPGPDFGGNPVRAAEYAGLFVVEFDPAGNHIWSNGFQAISSIPFDTFPWKVTHAAVDGVGNAYILYGITDLAGDLNDTTYLAKVSAGGAALSWRKTLTGDGIDGAGSLAIDSAGNVLVANETPTTELHLGPLELTVSKFTPAGVLSWRRSFASSSTGGTAAAVASSVVVDAADEVLVTAFTDGTIDFGGGVLPEGPVLVKLDAAGQHLFSRSVRFGDEIALDPAGGLLVAGHGLARLDASGTEIGSVDFDALVADIAIAPNGTVAVAGSTLAPVDFGTGPIAYAAGRDIFVATFDPFCENGESDCESVGGGGAGGSGGGGAGGSGSGGGAGGSCAPGSVLACYTGPVGTVGVGPCATGTQTCRADGLGYGPCTGAVAPAPELCATPVDESCDGAPHCPRLPPWARAYGGPGRDSGLSILSDAWGNTYVSGDFEGTVDFGAGPLTSAGDSDIFLLKLDPSGSVIWSRRFGTELQEASATMAVDESGNIFLAGFYYTSFSSWALGPDFGGGGIPPIPDPAFFVAQFDPEGNHTWSNGFNITPWPTSLQKIAVDGGGNVFVLYIVEDNYYMTKVGAGGAALLWTQGVEAGGLPPSLPSSGGGLAVDSAGNVLVSTGSFATGLSLGPGVFRVAKRSATGALLWERRFESTVFGDDPVHGRSEAWAYSLAVNAADEVLVTGVTDGSVDFGNGMMGGSVLVKLDAAGEVISTHPVPFHERISLDPAGGMFVAGNRGLAKLDDSGATLWSAEFHDPTGDGYNLGVRDIALSPNGTVAIVGTAYSPMDFGTGTLPYTAQGDIFVATFNP
ncbi:hypothetical protein WME97_03605 [Sorangium sp. So ce367]|uniref:hypothetical protein n=1 Tax=Sorangium sp. So ce367 TaxID=3133305 RepID=UPI003F6023B5